MFTPFRALVLLFVVTAALYAPTVGYPFVYEDANDMETSYSAPQWREAVIQLPNRPSRSLTRFSFGLNQELFGEINPVGFHAGNVALHLVNGLLLWVLIPSTWTGVFLVGLWWLHPLQVESVAYISSRSDLLLITVVLCGLLAVRVKRWDWVAVCAVVSVLAKETGIVAGVLLTWYAWHQGYRMTRRPVYTALLCSLWALWVFRAELHLDLFGTAAELTKAWRFALMVVWPVGFSIDHDWSWITPLLAGSVLVGTGVLAMVILSPPNYRVVFALGWALIALSPRLLVPLAEGLHEHHMSLPLMGAVLSAGLAVPRGVLTHGTE